MASIKLASKVLSAYKTGDFTTKESCDGGDLGAYQGIDGEDSDGDEEEPLFSDDKHDDKGGNGNGNGNGGNGHSRRRQRRNAKHGDDGDEHFERREYWVNRALAVAFVLLGLVFWRDYAPPSIQERLIGSRTPQNVGPAAAPAPANSTPDDDFVYGHMQHDDVPNDVDDDYSAEQYPESLKASVGAAGSRISDREPSKSYVDDFVDPQFDDDSSTNEVGEIDAAKFLDNLLTSPGKIKDSGDHGVRVKLDLGESGVVTPYQLLLIELDELEFEPNYQHPLFETQRGTDDTKHVRDAYAGSYTPWDNHFRSKTTINPYDGWEEGRDVPVFWRIPRSASGTIEKVMSYCYGLVLASAIGVSGGHEADEKLGVIKVDAGGRYVNVDVSNTAGIEHAISMNLGSSDLVDAVSTPYLYEAANIFSNSVSEKGKCFTMLRHPVEREVSLFLFYKSDIYKDMTIEEYAEQVAGNNWMVRFLTGRHTEELSFQDLEVAKEVFGQNCLVGLVDRTEESLRRFAKHFQWYERVKTYGTKEGCLRMFLDSSDYRQEHPTFEGTAVWETLRKKNEYDVLLFEYGKNLYEEQTSFYD